ncbi:hypothetical protein N658DRAFT_493664, partial [Parathielavia hyrcaniae]
MSTFRRVTSSPPSYAALFDTQVLEPLCSARLATTEPQVCSSTFISAHNLPDLPHLPTTNRPICIRSMLSLLNTSFNWSVAKLEGAGDQKAPSDRCPPEKKVTRPVRLDAPTPNFERQPPGPGPFPRSKIRGPRIFV